MTYIDYRSIHTIVFDFDGVFTDNKVLVSEEGTEFVKCSRADGLGIDMLRDFIDKKKLDIDSFVLSTESNDVVKLRCKKLKLKCFNGVNNKKEFLQKYLLSRGKNEIYTFKGLVYLGNDLNDFESMISAGVSVCPCDAHEKIKEISTIVIEKQGGEGFVRYFIEALLGLR